MVAMTFDSLQPVVLMLLYLSDVAFTNGASAAATVIPSSSSSVLEVLDVANTTTTEASRLSMSLSAALSMTTDSSRLAAPSATTFRSRRPRTTTPRAPTMPLSSSAFAFADQHWLNGVKPALRNAERMATSRPARASRRTTTPTVTTATTTTTTTMSESSTITTSTTTTTATRTRPTPTMSDIPFDASISAAEHTFHGLHGHLNSIPVDDGLVGVDNYYFQQQLGKQQPQQQQIIEQQQQRKSPASLPQAGGIGSDTLVAISSDQSITNVTAQIGTNAYLPCKVTKILNKSVSWVRMRDDHILTVDRMTFIADERFNAFQPNAEHENADQADAWQLQIKFVQARDEGLYECQVSSEPKVSAKIRLNVVVPRTEIIGDTSRFVKEGSKVSLHCIVTGAIEPPLYIIWHQGEHQIFPDDKRGWRTDINRESVTANPAHGTIGTLTIPAVKKRDSGNYTCSPSNSQTISILLQVISGEYSASAITSAASFGSTHCRNGQLIVTMAIVVGTVLMVLAQTTT